MSVWKYVILLEGGIKKFSTVFGSFWNLAKKFLLRRRFSFSWEIVVNRFREIWDVLCFYKYIYKMKFLVKLPQILFTLLLVYSFPKTVMTWSKIVMTRIDISDRKKLIPAGNYMFKVNKDARTTPLASFWYLYC